jgi:hypothetical protein
VRVLGIVIATCLASTAFAEDRVELEVLHEFPGIDVVFSVNERIMQHGGPPVTLDYMSINFEVRDTRAHTISVRGLAMTSDCKRKKRTFDKLKIKGHELYAWDSDKPVKGTASVSTPSGKAARYQVRVLFDEVKSAEGCAFAVDVVVDRVRKKIELPLHIKKLIDIE